MTLTTTFTDRSGATPQTGPTSRDSGTPDSSDEVFANLTAVGCSDVDVFGEHAANSHPVPTVRMAVDPPVISEGHTASSNQPVVPEDQASTSRQVATPRKRIRRKVVPPRPSTRSATRGIPATAGNKPVVYIEITSEEEEFDD